MRRAIFDILRARIHEGLAMYYFRGFGSQESDAEDASVLGDAAYHARIAIKILESRKVHNSPEMDKGMERLYDIVNARLYS